MVQVQWHLRITLDSSTRDRAKELAQAERRSMPNYVAALIERDQQVRKENP
jgi:hypothetical protein